MSKLDDALKSLILRASKRAAKDLLGNVPARVRRAEKGIRSLQKAISDLTKQVAKVLEEKRAEAPLAPAAEEEVQQARFTRRTLPALRKKLGLSQQELAHLLEVAAITVSSWERGKKRPTGGNWAKIVALREMSQEEVKEALGRESAPAAMSPEKIKQVRAKLGLTQGELAKLLRVSSNSVTNWEGGRSAPGSANRKALAEIGGLSRREVDKRLKREKKAEGKKPGKGADAGLSGGEIKALRKNLGLPQKGLADKLGVSANSISNWETGATVPRKASIDKLLRMRG
jgi:DNA-binding transcriptional regulator YiaG